MNRAERRHETERVKASFYRKQKDRPWWATTQASAGMYANHGGMSDYQLALAMLASLDRIAALLDEAFPDD